MLIIFKSCFAVTGLSAPTSINSLNIYLSPWPDDNDAAVAADNYNKNSTSSTNNSKNSYNSDDNDDVDGDIIININDNEDNIDDDDAIK